MSRDRENNENYSGKYPQENMSKEEESTMSFDDFFAALTGNPPFPWQRRLFEAFSRGEYPPSAQIPTGLGKTSVVAVWLITLALRPEQTPRRLVYVVNRRTVVDQTTTEVEKIRKALIDNPQCRELVHKLRSLCALPLSETMPPLAVSTLRGQFADNREWSVDITLPAVIIGTVDMIGSGLLFSRYTVGFKLRPHHAAFLGQDALLIHDEAHLEPAFQQLLESIVAEQKTSHDPRKLKIMELSATTRSQTLCPAFQINQEDKENTYIKKRLHAVKQLTLVPVSNEKDIEKRIIQLAWDMESSNRPILIFVNTVKAALTVKEGLEKKLKKSGAERVLALTGTMRGKERDEMVTMPVFQRFMAQGKNTADQETVWLVATSAGEVGVNISACHQICDVSTYESMAQRFGRVNRFGEYKDSSVTIVYPTSLEENKTKKTASKIDTARKQTLALLQKLEQQESGVSPAELEKLNMTECLAAFSPTPRMRTATSIQYDAWALTSIRQPIAARPPVAPYLHGEAEWEPPETHVAWREEPDIIRGEILTTAFPPEELLETYPLKPHELLRDTTQRITDILVKRIEKYCCDEQVQELSYAWLIAEGGNVQKIELASKELKTAYQKGKFKNDQDKRIIKRNKEHLANLLANATIILPASFGGIDSNGLFSSNPKQPVKEIDVSAIKDTRCRIFSPTPEIPASLASEWRLVRCIDTETGHEEPSSSPRRYWLWLQAIQGRQYQHSHNVQTETLADHGQAVIANIHALCTKLFPAVLQKNDINWPLCLETAARYHDAGKDCREWQLGIGNTAYNPEKHETILAKSGKGMRPRHLTRNYRHEFGSICTIDSVIQSPSFSTTERDIILHLIAAHHGRARPHFPVRESIDYRASPDTINRLAAEVPHRFARLQHHFGRWGLVWIESLLRSADYAASAGIVAEDTANLPLQQRGVQGQPAHQKKSTATMRLNVDVLNPGQYFACCGLFELLSCLVPEATSHFEMDANKQWWFMLSSEVSMPKSQDVTLKSLLHAFAAAELTVVKDKSREDQEIDTKTAPLEIGAPFHLRLDWWETVSQQTSALKVWAGSMDCYRIALAMKDAVGDIVALLTDEKDAQRILFASRVVYDKTSRKKVEPFYFDVNRGPNADARDVGFSANGLKFETLAAPAVEVLCLIGLQRAIPSPGDTSRRFIYHLWTRPLPISLLAAAVQGELPNVSTYAYCFESWFRTSQKKHKAFLAAQPVVRS